MAASHFLSTGRGQSAGGGGRSAGGRQQSHSHTFTDVQRRSAQEASIHLIWQDPRGLVAAAG